MTQAQLPLTLDEFIQNRLSAISWFAILIFASTISRLEDSKGVL